MAKLTAFALGGLGGFNAHGAGFLTAARELERRPDLVTVTSGQIIVLAEWLQGHDLEKALIDPQRPAGIFSTLATALTGDPGIFQPAIAEYWQRWMRAGPELSQKFFRGGRSSARGAGDLEEQVAKTLDEDLFAKLFPAEEYRPMRSKAYLENVASVLNRGVPEDWPGGAIGVVFNAYEPTTGKGVLFGNEAAARLLTDVALEAITPEAVESALWLSLYGFERLPKQRMDGAYHRPCVIAELHGFDRIFAVRPLANGWQKPNPLPRSWFDVQDWQCEMWFSSGYKAEVAELTRINKLIESGSLAPSSGYKNVELIEVCTRNPCGYFNYFTERPDVFREALEEGKKKLNAHP